LIVSYCDLLGGLAGIARQGNVTVTWGARNTNADPRFQSPLGADGVAGTPDDDLHVQSDGPGIDAGDNTAVPPDVDDLNANGNRLERLPFDLDGRPRFADRPDVPNTGVPDGPLYPQVVDLGAYELGDASAP
jgi:hypothetical protein